MAQLIASILGFALGLLFLPMVIPGMRVRGTANALKAGVVGGILSTLLGKLLLVLLTLVFFLPIVLTGPVGAFVVQGVVNTVLLWMTARMVEGIEFDRMRSTVWAGFALTLLQLVARHLGPS
jgi:uncharacterized membrane protein YvlD (DUF360 family)